jgi:chromosome partitioning protein
MPTIITVTNRKGGCGKTTLSISLAQLLSRQGFSLALIDLDSQSNPAVMLGGDPSNDGVTNWLEGCSPAFQTIAYPKDTPFQLLDGLSRIPAIKENTLHQLTKQLPHDIVIFDCGPGEGILSMSSTVIADIVVIPMLTDAFSGAGATAVEVLTRPEQEVIYVFNHFKEKQFQDTHILSRLKAENPGFKILTVRPDETLRNSCTGGFGLPKKGRASEDIWKLATVIIKTIEAKS